VPPATPGWRAPRSTFATDLGISGKSMRRGYGTSSTSRWNAEIFGQIGTLGCVTPGALADLLVVDGDPVAAISLLEEAALRCSRSRRMVDSTRTC